eukprot:10398243-Heterocapsa_arctica.AAC.1
MKVVPRQAGGNGRRGRDRGAQLQVAGMMQFMARKDKLAVLGLQQMSREMLLQVQEFLLRTLARACPVELPPQPVSAKGGA